jgi:long-chain fatty acid transport protein
MSNVRTPMFAFARGLPPGGRAALAMFLAFAPAVSEGTAQASGFLADKFGADQGSPALGNTYSVYFNPAAMAGMHGSELTLDGTFVARSLDYNRSKSALSYSGSGPNGDPLYTESNTGQAHLFNILAAPYLGFVTDFGGSGFRLGLASYIPFGGEASWGKNSGYAHDPVDPGAYDGSQRWSSISNTTLSIYETLALAYRFEKPRLGIGVNVSAIETTLKDVRARNVDGSDDVVTGSGVLKEGRSNLDVSGFQIAAAAGLYWEATADGRLRFGASYTSQPNFGTMRLNGSFKLTEGALVPESNNSVDLLQAYPDIVRLGMAWRITPETEIRLDGDWERWSQFKSQCVVSSGGSCPTDSTGAVNAANAPNVKLDLPRNWQDTVRVHPGVAYWVTPATEVSASAFWESPPVGKGHQDPLIFDSTRVGGTVGLRHGFNRHFYGGISYTYVYLLPVTVSDSVYNTYQGASNSPSTNGSYSSSLYILDAAISYRF